MCVSLSPYIQTAGQPDSRTAGQPDSRTAGQPDSRKRQPGVFTVGFHNLNLRIFNLRVSNPNKLIVDVFLTRCRISMCQGLGPKKHDEISEIDRKSFWAAAAALRRSAS